MKDKQKYIDHIATHSVPLFFNPFWLEMYHNEWHVIYEKKENDFCFFIYCIEKKMTFSMVRNGFLTPYNGFLFSDHSISPETKQYLVSKVIKRLPAFHELHIDMHPDAGIDFKTEGFLSAIKITNILPISDMDAVTNDYKASLKRQINKARKKISIIEQDDIRLFYALYEKTFLKQNLKTAIPFYAFEIAWNTCKKIKCGQLFFAADADENIHAALFLVFDTETAYYLAGGTDATFYGSGAMSYLMHHAIEFASAQQNKYFDFEGSMLPNVNTFFKNFNPIEKQYLSISKMDSLLLKMIKKVRKH